MSLKGFLGLLLIALLGGCATMTADECMVADWYRLGQQDARDGRQADFLAQRAGACRDAGFATDADAWYAGYEDGLIGFCTAERGFRFGHDGQHYRRICPPDLEVGFLSGYDLGFGLYTVGERISQSSGRLAQIEREIRRERDRATVDHDKIADLRREQRELQRLLRSDELEFASLRGVAVGRGFSLGSH
ncbi:MAG: DUF2799 domain-containing protein [Wenzhouxiangella sp.]